MGNAIKLGNLIRIIVCHVVLYIFAIFYVLVGAYVFYNLEGNNEMKLRQKNCREIALLSSELIHTFSLSNDASVIEEQIRHFLRNISAKPIVLESYLTYCNVSQDGRLRWTYESSVLFAFTILTTIGYGNVVPSTYEGRLFTMVYGAIGIPLCLITIADLGCFLKIFVMYMIERVRNTETKKRRRKKLFRELAEVFIVATLFIMFIATGSAILSIWEHDLTYFDSVYLSYMRMDFLVPTLIYITIGLWLTTALVEQLVDVFRLIHYYGRHVKNVKGISVWLGGRRVSVGVLINTVCRRIGLPDQLSDQINWDRTLNRVLVTGEYPNLQTLLPIHFLDFIKNEPPLIDNLINYEEMEGSFYCSAQNHPLHKISTALQLYKLKGNRNKIAHDVSTY